jgi:hypothetical protein
MALAALTLSAMLAMGLQSVAQATKPDDDGEHKQGLCHRTASDTNPYVFIEVDVASLPAHLNDLPGHPAKQWKTDGTFRGAAHVAGDLKSDYVADDALQCVDTVTPTETPSPTPTETTPPPTTPPPTSPPPCKTKHCDHWHPTWTPTWEPTGGATPGEHPLASTGFDAGDAAIAGGVLAALGLGSLALRRRSAE